jgi:hypothetical protein
MFMFIGIFNIYFLGMFNASEIKGNTFKIGAIFGLSELFGTFAGERILTLMPHNFAMIACISIILIVCTLMKTCNLSEELTYVLFLV